MKSSDLRVLYVTSWTSSPNSSLAACLNTCSRKPSEPRPSCLVRAASAASPSLQTQEKPFGRCFDLLGRDSGLGSGSLTLGPVEPSPAPPPTLSSAPSGGKSPLRRESFKLMSLFLKHYKIKACRHFLLSASRRTFRFLERKVPPFKNARHAGASFHLKDSPTVSFLQPPSLT